MNLKHLLVPARETRTIDLLSEVCFWSDIQVLRVQTGTEHSLPNGWTRTNTAVHGGPGFCRKIAATLGAVVAEPDDGFLAALPPEFARRTIRLMRLGQARALTGPKFIKPVNDKHFRAAVYASGADLVADASLDEKEVLVSDPVVWECEYRMFVLDTRIETLSRYAPGDAAPQEQAQEQAQEQEQARAFCERVLVDARVRLPRAVVLDVGHIDGAGWAVVEANAAVMCSLYDCDPIAVLGVLEYGLTPL